MNTVKQYRLSEVEKAKRGLLDVGVDAKFVSELGDEAATELHEGIMRLLQMRREQEG